MKNISYPIIIILAIVHLFINNPAEAAERMKIFEMAESGITIKFRMTPEEIAAEDAENKRLQLLKVKTTKSKKMEERLTFIEMGEGGQTVSFPMTAEDFAAEKAENEIRAAIWFANSQGPKKQAVIFELAESGDTFEFPIENNGAAKSDQYLADSADGIRFTEAN